MQSLIDKKKVICMTHMAVYDKRDGDTDRRMNEYFRNDFIARKNFITRLCVFIGGAFVIFFYWLHKIVIDGVDIFSLDYVEVAINMGIFLLALMVFYTVAGTIMAAAVYEEGQKRIKEYIKMMNQLERLKAREERHTEKRQEVSDLYYGADFTNKRNDDQPL